MANLNQTKTSVAENAAIRLQVVELVKLGQTPTQIANVLKLTKVQVGNHKFRAKEIGLLPTNIVKGKHDRLGVKKVTPIVTTKKRTSPKTNLEKKVVREQIYKLRNQGKSISEVSKLVGVNARKCRDWYNYEFSLREGSKSQRKAPAKSSNNKFVSVHRIKAEDLDSLTSGILKVSLGMLSGGKSGIYEVVITI